MVVVEVMVLVVAAGMVVLVDVEGVDIENSRRIDGVATRPRRRTVNRVVSVLLMPLFSRQAYNPILVNFIYPFVAGSMGILMVMLIRMADRVE